MSPETRVPAENHRAPDRVGRVALKQHCVSAK
jgi:hypothetical protein